VREELRRDVPDFKFHIWVEPLKLVSVRGTALSVSAPDHVRTWVRDRYLPLVIAAAQRGFHPQATVEMVRESRSEPATGTTACATIAPSKLHAKFTFEQFVIGRGNRFAHAAALAVAELPGQAYNPLFIHGRPGLGKTHLLNAIGNYVERFGSGLTVRCATVEEFTTEFVAAVRAQQTAQFKQRFRTVDVLLLDDVQFLARKARTEEELFHTFNFLHGMGRQLVMTSDREPDEIEDLHDRLGERFASGLVVALEPPDLPVRRAILAKRARLDGVAVSDDLLQEIASRVTTSVRALEAALIQVIAYASLRGEAPTPDLARQLLRKLTPDRANDSCDIETIVAAAAIQFGVPREALLARDRRSTVARARKVAMYLARELTCQSLPEIGRDFGGRDHATVLHAVRSVTTAVGTDPDLALAVESLKHRLSTSQ